MSNWKLDQRKILSDQEVKRLRHVAAAGSGKTLARLRDWFVVELGLLSGLRVSEMSALRVGELFIENGKASLLVRCGKGGKRRVVFLPREFRTVAAEYLAKVEVFGIELGHGTPVLVKQGGSGVTTRLLEKRMKELVRRAGLPETITPHTLRHTYGTALYRASRGNLRLVQEQLGHSSISTTMVYTHLVDKDRTAALARLYR